jgi:hypothetical protein
MDFYKKSLTANYPYPNLVCTVNFKCDLDGTISSNIVATSNRVENTWPSMSINKFLISSLPVSSLNIFGSSRVISVDVS